MQARLSALRGRKISVSEKILWIALLLFLLGATVGIYSGGYVQNALDADNGNVLMEYFASIRDGLDGRNFWEAFLNNLLPSVLSALLGTSLIGWILLPAYLMFRGFVLGFSAASTVIMSQQGAARMVFGLLGADAFLVIPSVFVVSAVAIEQSLSLFRRGEGKSRGTRTVFADLLKCLLFAGGVAVVATWIELFLSSRIT